MEVKLTKVTVTEMHMFASYHIDTNILKSVGETPKTKARNY